MISSGPAYIVCMHIAGLFWCAKKLMKCRPCRQHSYRLQLSIPSFPRHRIPSYVSLHWNISIGRWNGSVYGWFRRSCVPRLAKEEHSRLLSDICGLTGRFWCVCLPPGLQTMVSMRKETSGMGRQWDGELEGCGRRYCGGRYARGLIFGFIRPDNLKYLSAYVVDQ